MRSSGITFRAGLSVESGAFFEGPLAIGSPAFFERDDHSWSTGIEAIQRHHRRVRFLSTVELVNALELEKAAGKKGQLAYRLTHIDLVILGELGYQH